MRLAKRAINVSIIKTMIRTLWIVLFTLFLSVKIDAITSRIKSSAKITVNIMSGT